MHTSILKTARRILFLIAYYGWVKPTTSRTVSTDLLGFSIVVPPTVFHPKFYFTSKFFAEFIQAASLRGKRILDIGCGSGILSLAGARAGGKVTSIDINPAAIAATSENARQNGLADRICAFESDVLDRLDPAVQTFDCVFSNPPYYGGEAKTMAEKAFKGGHANSFMVRLAKDLPKFLLPGATVVVVLSSDIDIHTCLLPFMENQFTFQIIKTKRLFFETLSLIELRHVPSA